ncbi:11484_t:CDS:2 [Diversispora eburnea]|uniref:11484_t:CDS:1 n=1 Tax=Diversispora eburnea TaxID=1213867 RepID=A0A9N8UWU3_9GLOM|nr:11484_t:CDS:2 [Diversispora eburnea]
MSAMSYNNNSVYTPTTMFRHPTTSFTSPSLHANTNNGSNNNSPYSLHLYPPLNEHQSSPHPSMTTPSTPNHWPSSPDKQRLNHYPPHGSNTITVNMPFGSNFPSNGSCMLHMLDDKSKTQRSMMDSLPTPATISTSIPAFQGPPQHMIPQHSSGNSSLPPPPNQSLLDSMSPVGRNQSRTLTNSKRAAQNRAAQRAFRQRKDKYIKDLEAKAKDLDNTKKQLDTVLKEKMEMSQTIKSLKAEISKLKGDDVSEDEGRQVFGNNNMNNGTGTTSTSNYSHYGNSTRNDDDPQGLGDEPWLRHKDPSRKDCNNTNDERSNSFPFSPRGGSGLVLPPGPNTDSSVDPYFRDYQDTDRVYDDLCELLKTRTRPSLPQNIGNLWQPHPPSQQGVVSNGSSTVVG